MTGSTEPGTILVCGAGIAGLTLAWWLDRDGWDVRLVERATGRREEGYVIDFFGSGYDVAERMGLRPELEAVRYDVGQLVNVNRRGRPVSRLDYDQLVRLMDGRLLSLMRGDLERVLAEALPSDVPVTYDCSVEAVEQDEAGVTVQLTDGNTERVDLLVGADGIHSRVRQLVFGPEATYRRYMGYHTAAYLFEDDRFERALDGQFKLLTVPNRIAGFYPVRDGRIATWFAFETPDPALPDDPCAALATNYADLGWLVPDAVERCRDADGVYYDQVAQIELDGWSRGRVTLVGDAGYAVSLLAGQGASMAMGGAYVLARELRRGGPLEEALARYEATMRPNAREKQAAGRRMASFLIPPTRWHVGLRNLALHVARLPGLGRVLAPALQGTDSVVEDR